MGYQRLEERTGAVIKSLFEKLWTRGLELLYTIWAIGTGPTARKAVLSIGDQALVSGTNFLAAYSLARWSGQEEFGSYVLAFSVMLILTGIQQSLLTSPMSVLGPGKQDGEFKRYATTMFLGQMLLNIGLVSFSVLSALGIKFFPKKEAGEFKRYATTLFIIQMLMNFGLVLICGLAVLGVKILPFNEKLYDSLLGMTLAIVFIQFQEFTKRMLYVKLRVNSLFLNDLLFCSIRIAGILLLLMMSGFGAEEGWLTSRNIFLVHGIGGLIAGVVGFFQIKVYLDLDLGRMSPDIGILRENWNFGKWILGTFAGSILESQVCYFVIAGLLGIAAAAALEAPRLIMAPLQVLTSAGASMLTPLFARKYEQRGWAGLKQILAIGGGLWVAFLTCYFLVIVVAPGFWLGLFFDDNFLGGEKVLVLWSLVFLVLGLQVLPEITLMAMRKPDAVMQSGLGSSILILVLTAGFAFKYGVAGAVLARFIGEAAYLVMMVVSALKVVRLKPGAGIPAADETLVEAGNPNSEKKGDVYVA